ncbi:hypothetical protein CN957_12785 [Bacillus cereus]|nr:hypothetical protein CN957_12785 [Bacillus cereus]
MKKFPVRKWIKLQKVAVLGMRNVEKIKKIATKMKRETNLATQKLEDFISDKDSIKDLLSKGSK